MDANHIIQYFWPLVEVCWKNREIIDQDKASMIPFEHVWDDILYRDFMSIGVDINQHNYFERGLCQIVQEIPYRIAAVNAALDTALLPPLTSIVFSYLNLQQELINADIPPLITESKGFGRIKLVDDKGKFPLSSSGLAFTVPVEQLRSVKAFFTAYTDASFFIWPFKGEGWGDRWINAGFKSYLMADHKALLDEGLRSDIRDTLACHPNLDQFQKESGTVKFTTREACLSELENIRKQLSKEYSVVPLLEPIKSEPLLGGGQLNSRAAAALDNAIQNLMSAVEDSHSHLANIKTAIQEVTLKQSQLFRAGRASSSALFPPPASEAQKTIDTTLSIVLVSLTKVVDLNPSASAVVNARTL